jgi:hypothetical protein
MAEPDELLRVALLKASKALRAVRAFRLSLTAGQSPSNRPYAAVLPQNFRSAVANSELTFGPVGTRRVPASGNAATASS